MTRHELLISYQTEPPSSRPAGNLASGDEAISIHPSSGNICHGKCSSKGLFIAPQASDLPSSTLVHARPPTGQIQKNP